MPAKGTGNPAYVYRDTDKKHKRPYVRRVCAGCGEEKLIAVRGEFCSRSCSLRTQHAAGPRAEMPSGPDHYAWKETGASYIAHHNRVRKARGRADHCELRAKVGCGGSTYEWAHTHGTDPGDPANYRSLCKSCHIAYDGGSQGGPRKLSEGQWAEVRELYKSGGFSQRQLAAMYRVSAATVSNIIRTPAA